MRDTFGVGGSRSDPIDALPVHALQESSDLIRVGLALATAFATFGLLYLAGASAGLLNAGMPVLVSAVLGYQLFTWVKNSPLAVWSTAFWFLVPCVLYYGIGPLVYVFGSGESIGHLDSFYYVDETRLLRTNLLNLFCLSIILFVAGAATRPFRHRYSVDVDRANPRLLRRAAVVMMVVGLPVKYFIAVPSTFGLIPFEVPSALQYLGFFASLAIIPFFWAYRVERVRPSLFIWLFVGAELLVAFLSFSKLEVLRVFVILLIALSFNRRGFRTLLFGGVAVAAFYVIFLSPFIAFMRMEYGLQGTSDISALRTGYSTFQQSGREEVADINPGVQGWWTRLSYPNAQAFCMDSFDLGAKGYSYDLIVPSLLPRVLFPDKPNITIGDEFNQLVTGNALSKSACGAFGEGYWNGGWLGAALTSLYLGLFVAFFCVYARWLLSGYRVFFLPTLWIGLSGSLQPDSWFAATFVGPMATFVIYHVLLRWVLQPAFEGKVSIGRRVA